MSSERRQLYSLVLHIDHNPEHLLRIKNAGIKYIDEDLEFDCNGKYGRLHLHLGLRLRLCTKGDAGGGDGIQAGHI